LTIHKCYLAFINNQYVRQGEIDASQLFTVQDISEEVAAAEEGINERIAEMQETFASPRCPEIPVGAYCSDPYDCPVAWCWEQLPENNIFSLYRGGKKCFDLFSGGILQIKDIPENYKLNRAQQIQQWCELNDRPHIEGDSIRDYLETVMPMEHYLDFETINPAVPLFDGVRPYQRVPFQFSLHIDKGDGTIQHHSFLADGPGDPRPEFLKHLKNSIGPWGCIVTYNQAFEEGVLKELAEAFPEYDSWICGIRERLVDLLKPFQNFHCYSPLQHGSASIKSVMPAITGRGYEDLEIAEGGSASQAYLDMTYGRVTPEERQQIRANLEKYCGRDTEGMIWIVEKLREIIRE
jgi:hypothetical protein